MAIVMDAFEIGRDPTSGRFAKASDVQGIEIIARPRQKVRRPNTTRTCLECVHFEVSIEVLSGGHGESDTFTVEAQCSNGLLPEGEFSAIELATHDFGRDLHNLARAASRCSDWTLRP